LAEDRFHLTIIPLLAILAARFWDGGIGDLKQLATRSNAGKIAIVAVSLVVLLLLFNWGYELVRDMDKLAQLFGPGGNRSGFPY